MKNQDVWHGMTHVTAFTLSLLIVKDYFARVQAKQ